METAELLFNHAFKNFGLPEDIVSIQLQSMESHLLAPGCDCQPHVRIPSPDKRANGEEDPGSRLLPLTS